MHVVCSKCEISLLQHMSKAHGTKLLQLEFLHFDYGTWLLAAVNSSKMKH